MTKKELDTYNAALDTIILLGREFLRDQSLSEAESKANGDLDRLVRRFEKMADMRLNHAATKRLRRDDSGESAEVIESAASAYRRCADELRRFANGEEPPEPGYRWD